MLRLHNQLSGKKEVFVPLDDSHVRVYVCGPTVYDRAHIGNGRPVVVFDLLVRLLRHFYERVTYVRNITDVDDKIMTAARESGETIDALTHRMTQLFHEDMASLCVLPPDVEPRATQHIEMMVTMIEQLLARGHAYEAEHHVLFAVSSWDGYGVLSKREEASMQAGARVAVEEYKKDARDFVLWKPSSDDEIGWDSPWGRGRPGWHIECSAMSHHYLGTPFDIHGGGQDLIFPHHENEIAQSCACVGTDTMARFWVHNGYVTCDGEKMSKSLGNVRDMGELLQEWQGEVLRIFLLMTHYRKPLDCSHHQLQEAERFLDSLYRMKGQMVCDDAASLAPDVMAALADDLNVSLALSLVHDYMSKGGDDAQQGLAAAQLMGLLRDDSDKWLQKGVVSDDVEKQIKTREIARAHGDFQKADAIRQALLEQGIVLEDKGSHTQWRKKRHYE